MISEYLNPPSTATDSIASYDAAEESPTDAVVLKTQPPLRTLDDVRLQVAHEVALRAITKARTVDGVRVGVCLTLPKSSSEAFLNTVADVIARQLTLSEYLFAIAVDSSSPATAEESTPLFLVSSGQEFLQRAILLASSKFLGRLLHSSPVPSLPSPINSSFRWSAALSGTISSSSYAPDALWDALTKAARAPIDPLVPPPGSRGIDQLLSDARAKLQRITPQQALAELCEPSDGVGAPTFLVDIRPEAQRTERGGIHGSLIIERNVLEWRFDPRCDARLAIADRYDLRVIVFCQEGYTSSLAAYALQQLGLLNATDIVGGYQAWLDAGLPTDGRGFAAQGTEVAPSTVPAPSERVRSLVSLEGSLV